MSLVNDKAVFHVSVLGENTGKKYEGDFTMKLFPSLKERGRIAVDFSRANEGNFEDQDMAAINRTVCEFLVLAESAPAWFSREQVFELQDFAPLLEVKKEFEKSQSEYSAKISH